MHVPAHEYAAFHHLLGLEATAHGKGLVHSHERLYPWIYEQVVANGYLARCGKTCLVKHKVQYGAVQHYVPVVGNEEIVATVGDGIIPEGVAACVLLQHIAHYVLHEAELEVKRSLHSDEHHLEEAVAQPLGQPRSKALHHFIEVAVIEQLVQSLLHLPLFIGAYLVKFV